MASIDSAKLDRAVPDPEEEQRAMEEIEVDPKLVETLYLLGVDMMKESGVLKKLAPALQKSSDPAQVVGQFLVQLIGQLAEVAAAEYDFDPRAFLARDGWLDLTLEFIEDELALPEEFSDQVKDTVLEMIKALSQGEKNPQPQAQAMPSAPQAIDQMVQGQAAPQPAGTPF
jgi:hypothetical protein